MKVEKGSVTSVPGFLAAGVACGLKANGNKDLALVVSDEPAVAAGVFTKNLVKGHSLVRTMERLAAGQARGIVINSGNANACVGADGPVAAEAMAASVAKELGCQPAEILTGSTGVIGKRLDLQAVELGAKLAVAELTSDVTGGNNAEQAIMTTDLIPKEGVARFEADGKTVTLAGMAKGSGMIHPNMATMICVITTDALISQPLLQQLLKASVDQTFNRVSVDGDTSVCDMVVVLANGKSGLSEILSDTPAANQFQAALVALGTHLSRLIARDGEGATKLIELQVNGARTSEDAYKIIQAVGKSPLVKTAMFGEDANWGRILTAAGYSGADFDPNGCDIYLGDLKVCEAGTALLFDEARASEILQENEILIRIELSDGAASDHLWTCDFSYDYVKINGSYRT
ncbi:MAG: bifunctional glutamate N-acetyltransferase/amino-acid acetyltransferase ArgJ [Ruminococcaceae bacterium]|nr:bifunctional glutamate N-acetyltransferase/amino-acid acetyltransferase ArgJ [Oscillospiraceae bacterium]